MNLIKYRPRTLFDTMFDDSFVSYPRQFDLGFDPSVDVTEHEKDYVISFELPGVDKKDIRVSVENGYLMISGEKKYESSDGDTNTWFESQELTAEVLINAGPLIDEDQVRTTPEPIPWRPSRDRTDETN